MKYKVIEKINIQYDGTVLKLDDESDFAKLSDKEIGKLLNQKYITEVLNVDVNELCTTVEEQEESGEPGELVELVEPGESGELGEPGEDFLSEDALNEMKSKSEIITYGKSIGTEGLSEKKTREDLIQIILDHIEDLELGDDSDGDE